MELTAGKLKSVMAKETRQITIPKYDTAISIPTIKNNLALLTRILTNQNPTINRQLPRAGQRGNRVSIFKIII